jgi:hypothetical protein
MPVLPSMTEALLQSEGNRVASGISTISKIDHQCMVRTWAASSELRYRQLRNQFQRQQARCPTSGRALERAWEWRALSPSNHGGILAISMDDATPTDPEPHLGCLV